VLSVRVTKLPLVTEGAEVYGERCCPLLFFSIEGASFSVLY
jgi:hypothetical protein